MEGGNYLASGTAKNGKLSIIPLGGLGEIGKNMTLIEYDQDILVIDAGLAFPDEELLGIDIVLPDMTYLLENKDRVRGIVLTHGHEDHIGALAYLLRDIKVPVYGTRLTLGLVMAKLREQNITESEANLSRVNSGESVQIGVFLVDFIRVNHSVADAVGLGIHTPVGTIVHSGDFKLDQTPVDREVIDLHKFAELGDQGVLVLLSDSTNADRPGYTKSERLVGQALDDIFRSASGRIILATFASNVHRIQQMIDAAVKHGRKVAVVGRSMVDVLTIATEQEYLKYPAGTVIDIDLANKLPKNEVAIISTGTQGEPMSALTRMAMADHKKVDIIPGDTVVLAATPIPGNEKLVARTINHLFRRGAKVIYEPLSEVHVSGHASREELKLMLNLVRPKYFIPVHGEYRHLVRHAEIAEEMDIPRSNIFIAEIGDVLDFTADTGVLGGKVPSGKVLVDGLGVGDIGNVVLRDRRQLSQDGILIVVMTIDKVKGVVVAGPDILSRGFVYVRESEKLMEEAKEKVSLAMEKYTGDTSVDWSTIKNSVRDTLGKYLYEKTRRRPMIMPIIMDV
jgi:ribonuclease J